MSITSGVLPMSVNGEKGLGCARAVVGILWPEKEHTASSMGAPTIQNAHTRAVGEKSVDWGFSRRFGRNS